jgi:hypothetical protein
MKLMIAAMLGLASADSSWQYMNPAHACIDSRMRLTCTFPSKTSYDKAYTMAASLPACTAGVYDCYNDQNCMFCFSHADEYYALEAAVGATVPACPRAASHLGCPKKADLQSWQQSGLLHKVNTFWGARTINLPAEFSN